jgi:hypothetical protein
MPIISTQGRQTQEDNKFEVSLGYVVRYCPKKEKNYRGLFKNVASVKKPK